MSQLPAKVNMEDAGAKKKIIIRAKVAKNTDTKQKWPVLCITQVKRVIIAVRVCLNRRDNE